MKDIVRYFGDAFFQHLIIHLKALVELELK